MLPSQRALFDIPRHVCFLNAASWSPLPIATQEAGRAGVARKGRPWLIDARFPAEQHERARRAAARLINADADDVALISSVSYGVAAAAKCLPVPAGSRVLVLANDHSSPCWNGSTRASVERFTVDVVAQPDDGDWTAAVLAAIERPGAPPLSLASISSVHWSDGGLLDIERVAAALRKQGAALLVDATHAVGVIKIDVRSLDPDVLVFPTYKWLLGPYGRAFLYIAKRHQDGVPLEQTCYGRRGVSSERRSILPTLSSCRRATFRHGRARSFHLAGDGGDRHGAGGAVGLRRRAGSAVGAYSADRQTGCATRRECRTQRSGRRTS